MAFVREIFGDLGLAGVVVALVVLAFIEIRAELKSPQRHKD